MAELIKARIVGVLDGVGSWAQQKVDPGKYAKALAAQYDIVTRASLKRRFEAAEKAQLNLSTFFAETVHDIKLRGSTYATGWTSWIERAPSCASTKRVARYPTFTSATPAIFCSGSKELTMPSCINRRTCCMVSTTLFRSGKMAMTRWSRVW